MTVMISPTHDILDEVLSSLKGDHSGPYSEI